MRTGIELAGDILVVRPAGPILDLVTAEEFKKDVTSVLTTEGDLPERVVVDLAGVEHVDSTGLGALISILKRSRRSGLPLSLRNVRPEVMEILDITLVSRVLRIEKEPA